MTTPAGATDADVPVCPRHPDVAAYTRCQRCNSPACTRCQVPASVGFQCVDCVAAERKANPPRPQRSALGVPAAPGAPLVTYGIIAICVAVWLGELASWAFFGDVAFVALAAQDEPWRYLTSGFAHDRSNVLHLLFNMMALYFMGQYLEPLIGRVRFAALYLLSVLGGSVGYQLLTSPPVIGGDLYASGWATPLVGASGGVFGLFLAVVVLNRRLGREIGPMVTMIVLNVVIGFTSHNVAWQAHLGGAVIGALTAGLLYVTTRRRPAVQFAALAAVGVALAIAAAVSFARADIGWVHVVG